MKDKFNKVSPNGALWGVKQNKGVASPLDQMIHEVIDTNQFNTLQQLKDANANNVLPIRAHVLQTYQGYGNRAKELLDCKTSMVRGYLYNDSARLGHIIQSMETSISDTPGTESDLMINGENIQQIDYRDIPQLLGMMNFHSDNRISYLSQINEANKIIYNSLNDIILLASGYMSSQDVNAKEKGKMMLEAIYNMLLMSSGFTNAYLALSEINSAALASKEIAGIKQRAQIQSNSGGVGFTIPTGNINADTNPVVNMLSTNDVITVLKKSLISVTGGNQGVTDTLVNLMLGAIPMAILSGVPYILNGATTEESSKSVMEVHLRSCLLGSVVSSSLKQAGITNIHDVVLTCIGYIIVCDTMKSKQSGVPIENINVAPKFISVLNSMGVNINLNREIGIPSTSAESALLMDFLGKTTNHTKMYGRIKSLYIYENVDRLYSNLMNPDNTINTIRHKNSGLNQNASFSALLSQGVPTGLLDSVLPSMGVSQNGSSEEKSFMDVYMKALQKYALAMGM